MSTEEIIQKFELEAHPEGGFYKRTYVPLKTTLFPQLFFY
jgi:predicted cupin superfamily sugar epimerase